MGNFYTFNNRGEVRELSEVADPVELFYELTPKQSQFYDRVIREYFGENGKFKGAIYQPYLYEKGYSEKLEEEFTYMQQKNLYDFMRRLLVKRFESSFKAFEQSVKNFIEIHEKVLEFIDKTQKYILDRRLIEKIWEEDEEVIQEYLRDFAEALKNKKTFSSKHDKVYELAKFKDKERFLSEIKEDFHLFQQIKQEVHNLNLVDDDPKLKCFIEAVSRIGSKTSKGEPKRKVVVFTEYVDTLKYVAKALEKTCSGRILESGKTHSPSFMETLIANFDASYPQDKQKDDYDILVATDRLSEGVNLNRAGVVINYDIPWNPTRVIQRLGRINRIGKKVFDTLFIYNFFPTEQGAEIVKSREIAAHKMFLIHNTLGEDAKIFAPDETPTPAKLFTRINRNPEELEEESFVTRLRQEFFEIKKKHPEVIKRLSDFPARIKTAKNFDKNELLVFRKKGLQLFIHTVEDTTAQKPEIKDITLDEALPHIRCESDTPIMPLSPNFWKSYEAVKSYRERMHMPKSERSLWIRAENNLRSAINHHASELKDYLDFIKTILRDIKEFQIVPRYTLRRLTAIEMGKNVSKKDIEEFKKELDVLIKALGKNYLKQIEEKIHRFKSEIIIAVENIV